MYPIVHGVLSEIKSELLPNYRPPDSSTANKFSGEVSECIFFRNTSDKAKQVHKSFFYFYFFKLISKSGMKVGDKESGWTLRKMMDLRGRS